MEGRDLCEKLIAMECFDNRFTMVVANRADCAKLPKDGFREEDIENKLGQTVCQTLHSQRIFYVSSIVGLGAKQVEDFIDEDYQDVFDKEIESYTNPNAKHPKSLYRYNIIPEQIKKHCMERSGREPNRAFANSGLFWIEQEIRIFAEIYSPYNKCTQSKYFLDEIIAETSERIDENQKGFEAAKKTLNDKLEGEQSACIEKLEKRAQKLCDRFSENYPTPDMAATADSAKDAIKREELEKRQAEIETAVQENNNYADQKEDACFFKSEIQETTEVRSDVEFAEPDDTGEKKGFVGNVLSTMKKTAQRTAKFATDTLHSTQDTIDKKRKLRDLEKAIEVEVAKILFEEVKQRFDSERKQHQTDLEAASEQYWRDASEDFRAKMIDAVTNSEGISDDKKQELEGIIASYEAIIFDKTADKDFHFDDFKRFFSNSLNLRKLTTRYNTLMHDYLNEIIGDLKTNHEGSYLRWEQSLLQKLKNNIIELNPELRKLQEQIDALAQQISNLRNRKERLLGYQLEIEHLMGWN